MTKGRQGTVTVGELIGRLSAFDRELPVVAFWDYCHWIPGQIAFHDGAVTIDVSEGDELSEILEEEAARAKCLATFHVWGAPDYWGIRQCSACGLWEREVAVK